MQWSWSLTKYGHLGGPPAFALTLTNPDPTAGWVAVLFNRFNLVAHARSLTTNLKHKSTSKATPAVPTAR